MDIYHVISRKTKPYCQITFSFPNQEWFNPYVAITHLTVILFIYLIFSPYGYAGKYATLEQT